MTEETLFIEASEIANPAERAAFLDRACAGNADLRGRLDKLLAQHAQLKKVTPEMETAVTVLQKVIAQGMARREVLEMNVELAAAMVMGVVLQVAVFRAYGRVTHNLSQLSETLTEAAWQVLHLEERGASAP